MKTSENKKNEKDLALLDQPKKKTERACLKTNSDSSSNQVDPKLAAMNKDVADILGRCDDDIRASGHEPEFGLRTAWEKIVEFDDAAGMIRQTIYQVKTLFDKMFADYFKAETVRELSLNELKYKEDFTGEDLVRLGVILAEQSNDRDAHIKQINAVSKNLKDLHKESRETAQAKQATIPFTEVLKMALAFKSIIHQEIHDKGQLDRISDHCNEVMRKLFPPGTGV